MPRNKAWHIVAIITLIIFKDWILRENTLNAKMEE